MERLERLRAFLDAHREYAFEVVRIWLGVGLFLKGVYFITHVGDVVSLLAQGSWQLPGEMVLGHLIGFAHLAGGAFLALGLVTRLAAAVQVPVLLGAVFFVHLRSGFFGSNPALEFSLLVLVLLALCTLHGGGPLSLDAYLTKSERAHRLTPA